MKIRADRTERTDGDPPASGTAAATATAPPHGPGFARSRRRALTLAGATAIAPGVRAATADSPAADPPARLRTGWILRPDDR
jgi:hypothetical protein